MVRLFATCAAVVFLIGCADQPIKIKSEAQEVFVPIIYCPEPPEIKRPNLPIEQLKPGDEKEPGKVAKSYKATVKSLQGYAVELETVLKQYKEANTSYDDLKKKIENEWRTRQLKATPIQ